MKNSSDKGPPAWLAEAVGYQIYPQSFSDSNGDGIGDLQGIIKKLDYLTWLGVDLLWINPLFTSPFEDAGYDVADYYEVAERYGTKEDLRELLDEAHRRGMRVLLDLVAGHTSVEHEWFKESAREDWPEEDRTERGETGALKNRYIWTGSWLDDGGPGVRTVNGYTRRDGNYVTNFFYCQPALNYGFACPDPEKPWQLPVDHPHVLTTREEMKKIIRYWLDFGIDGFRVDMASSLVKGDRGWIETSRFWKEVRDMVEEEYPGSVLISEWGIPSSAIKAGFHADFMLQFQAPGYTSLFRYEKGRNTTDEFLGKSYFHGRGEGNIQAFLREFETALGETRGSGFVALPTGNHDVPRISYLREEKELRPAYVFLFTLPAVPFIYYGDEIGMPYTEGLPTKEGGYNRTGARTPMQWTPGNNAGFSSAPADDLYLPIAANADTVNVERQKDDEDTLLSLVRYLISLRREYPELGPTGGFRMLSDSGDEKARRGYPAVYLRLHAEDGEGSYPEGRGLIICVNPSGYERSTALPLIGEDRFSAEGFPPGGFPGKGHSVKGFSGTHLAPVRTEGADCALENGKLRCTVAPLGWGIYRIDTVRE